MSMNGKELPIDLVIGDLKHTVAKHDHTILIAPPGAGKTTRVPLAFLDEPWLSGRKIIMLEPRRLSARSAARYMAAGLGEKPGDTVGYRVRNDTAVGPKTRIEVVTEGVLTRMLLNDPELNGVGLVIFDEFHERNLQGDTALSLCLHSKSLFGSRMRLLLMSATMETGMLSEWLDAPVIESEGRLFPVETFYLDKPVSGRLEDAVLRTLYLALDRHEGDVLVFLPGAPEIRRLQGALRASNLGSIEVHPLYGNLPFEQQDRAILPSPNGNRKIILSTPIAETGLTVEGVRIIIDSGLQRVSRFSARTGMSRLETALISRASADQRRGRAGRTSDGVCYRMWTEAEHGQLLPERVPEIVEADLAPLALELAEWGASPEELAWLTTPPKANYAQAVDLLQRLGALTEAGGITAHGSQMLHAGIHPRLAHMILKGAAIHQGSLACELAAILGERDLFRVEAAASADIRLRIEQLQKKDPGGLVDSTVFDRVKEEASRLKIAFGVDRRGKERVDSERSGTVLAFAYPDRIAASRDNGRYVLSNGRGAVFKNEQLIGRQEFLVAVDLDDSGADSRIHLAAPIRYEELFTYHSSLITERALVEWNSDSRSVRAMKQTVLGALLLKETPSSEADQEQIAIALAQGIRLEGLDILPWTRHTNQLRQRMAAMHHVDPDWPDVSDDKLLISLTEWLGPFIAGFRSAADLKRVPLKDALESLLTWEQRRRLDLLAPTHLRVPSGSQIPIDYIDPEAPFVSVRLQEVFGLVDTPRIAEGRLPITFHLLSPAQRPVQITRDLASFWRDTYYEVKKDLKGRYPKHYWPDEPHAAVATRQVRPKST